MLARWALIIHDRIEWNLCWSAKCPFPAGAIDLAWSLVCFLLLLGNAKDRAEAFASARPVAFTLPWIGGQA
jgi:hypothetical protein